MAGICFIFIALCCTSLAEFLYPQPSRPNDYKYGVLAWQQGSNQTIRWTTNSGDYSIYLWQKNVTAFGDNGGPVIYSKSNSDPEIGDKGYEWTVTQHNFNTVTSNVFYFLLKQSYEEEEGKLYSGYFNISASSYSSTSTSAASSTTPTTHPTASSSSQNSTNVIKIALGLGLGLGIPFIVLLAVAIWMVSKHIRSQLPAEPKNLPARDVSGSQWDHKPELSAEYNGKQIHSQPPKELDGRSMLAEVPA